MKTVDNSAATFAAMTTAPDPDRRSRPVAIWLLVGVAMIIIQVLLGGITRLTGSGLSITEWKPIMGALPPLNDHEWQAAFEKYKQIAQYKYVNNQFSLADFKFIFFWEWLHRLWARLFAVAFIIPFAIFLWQKRIRPSMVRPLVILFLLGGLQGLVGWIMVQSGLDDSELLYVSHYKLAVHFILALGLLCYTLWFALELLVPPGQRVADPKLSRFTAWLTASLVLQLIYGAFMAGLKAAPYAITWPDINGHWWPPAVHQFAGRSFPGWSFLFDNPLVVHFIHRNLAYVITIAIFIWYIRTARAKGTPLFQNWRKWPLVLVCLQVVLGIVTVLNGALPGRLLWLGLAHQFVAMLLLLALVAMQYLLRKNAIVNA